ncbi:MAG: hypothetical protein GXP36_10090 [Actinobacteria bacterium]|nr:hypothetical protein [Actinomycetota bacterium]
MSKLVKKIMKTGSEHLSAGEMVEEAILVQPPGRVMGQSVGGLAGIAIHKKIQKNREARTDGESVDGVANDIPGTAILAISSGGDVLAFTQAAMSGKVKELAIRIPRGDVAGFEAKKAKLVGKFSMSFKDGSAYHCDVAMSVGMKDFTTALQRHGIFGEMA